MAKLEKEYIDPILFEHGFFKNRTEYEAMVKRIAHAILNGEATPIEKDEDDNQEDWSYDKLTGWCVLDKVTSLEDDASESLSIGDKGTILGFEDTGVLVEFNIKNNTECTVLVVEREKLSNNSNGRNYLAK